MITGGLESPSRLTWLPGAPEGLELVARVDLARWLLPVDARCRKDERADRRLARLVQVAVRALHRSQWSIGYLRLRRTDDLREQLRRCLEEIDTSGLDLPAFAVVHRRNDAGSRTGVPDHVPELEADPLRAMALLSRVSGNVVVARRGPRLGALLAAEGEYWIYAAPAAPVKEVRA